MPNNQTNFPMHDPLAEPCLWSSTEAGLQKHVALHANPQQENAGRGGNLKMEGSRATIFVLGPLVRTDADAAYGETSYEEIRSSLQVALDDPSVETIELFVNSPGGDVSGLPELAGFIEGAARQKKMCAWIDGLGASAAYWLASATGDIRTSPSAQVGSIGVLYVHDDMTGFLKSFLGIERTWMQAGKYKTVGAPKKLSAEEKAAIQARLDAVYDQFTTFVATHMELDLSEKEAWADGRLFTGEKARALGLVTELQPFRELAAEPHSTWGNTMDAKTEPAVTAVEAREAEILAIAGVVLGEDAQKRLAGALGTKLTAEQLEAQKAFWQPAQPAADVAEPAKGDDMQKIIDNTVKAQLSALIQSAGPVSAAGVKTDDKRSLIEQIGRYGEGK